LNITQNPYTIKYEGQFENKRKLSFEMIEDYCEFDGEFNYFEQ
jgi:hypothetical protein